MPQDAPRSSPMVFLEPLDALGAAPGGAREGFHAKVQAKRASGGLPGSISEPPRPNFGAHGGPFSTLRTSISEGAHREGKNTEQGNDEATSTQQKLNSSLQASISAVAKREDKKQNKATTKQHQR